MRSLASKVRSRATLGRAWRKILENGLRSDSPITRREVQDFAGRADESLDRLERKLRAGSFKFPPSKGIAVKKSSGGKRPIVLAPIETRIIQRALLDVIQGIPAIKEKLSRGLNFGGIEGVGVPEAVEKARVAAEQGGYFIRTDIKSFFVNIPRELAVRKITDLVSDGAFNELLVGATNTELDNIAALGRDADLFPLEETGVAQGSCLSPLLCNLLLEDFDLRMNARGVTCIRYIDDFVLFANDRKTAFKALKGARSALSKLHLDAYDPLESSEKAEHGLCADGFVFLGCDVAPGSIRPSRAARRKLLKKIDKLFAESLGAARHPSDAVATRTTFAETLVHASHIIEGWGNTYSFCNDRRILRDLDGQIGHKLAAFREGYKRRIAGCDENDRRRLLGVFLLQDCKAKQTKVAAQ